MKVYAFHAKCYRTNLDSARHALLYHQQEQACIRQNSQEYPESLCQMGDFQLLSQEDLCLLY